MAMSLIKTVMSKLSAGAKWFWRRNWVVKIGVLVMVIGLGYLGVTRITASKSETPSYQTSTVEKGNLIVTVSGSGSVSTANNVSVTTSASGVVKKILVKNGDEVKSGQKLVEIELDQSGRQKYDAALASYQSAKNSLASAESNLYSLQSKLFAANQTFINDAVARELVTDDPTYIQENADWLAAEASYKTQSNVIAQARIAANSSWLSFQEASNVIYAPISGKITGLALVEGAVISGDSSEKIANVETVAKPTITINLTEIDVAKVSLEDKATVTLDAYSDKTFTGRVISIDTAGSVSSGVSSYPAVIELDTLADGVYPNMSATANIITDRKQNVILVPTIAVETQNNQNVVKVMKNGKVSTVVVETGLASDSQIEIVSGVNEGDEVVVGSTTSSSQTSQSGQSPFSSFGSGMRIH